MKNDKVKFKIIFKFLVVIFSFSLFVFSLAGEASAATASLYLSPSSGTHSVGSTFSVAVKVNSGGVEINAAEGTINFNSAQVNVVRVSKSGSIFSLWTQEPTFSNSAGNVVFGGGSPKAFKGTSGTIITITFKAKTSGTANVNFSAGQVLAADGKGTDILSEMNGGTYTLETTTVSPPAEEEEEEEYVPPTTPGEKPAAPVISSPTHSNEEKWYSNNDPEFTWKLPADVIKVSYDIDKKPLTNPEFVADSLVTEATFSNIEDGIWYFHINFKNSAGWGDLTHRKVLVDTKSPEPFEVKVENGKDPTNPTPVLIFEAEDTLSGIEYYEVKIGDAPAAAAAAAAALEENPYKMPPQAPGVHTVIVKAVDKADNFTSASKNVIVEPLESPVITEIPKTLEEGESLVIKGTSAYPEATIRVFIQKGDEQPTQKEVKTDKEGKWTYVHDEAVKEGTYKVWAEAVDQRGALSLPSEKISLTIAPRPLSEIFKGATLVIVILLLIIGILASYVFYQRREVAKKKKFLKRETEEIKKCVAKAFGALREETKERVSEKETHDKLKEALNISEEFIKKEIEDVEKGLK